MKFYTAFIIIVAPLTLVRTGQAAQLGMSPPVQIAERLFTAPVLEPNGSVAVCFATNLDTVARDLAAQIIDSRGVEVTQTSSCGAGLTGGHLRLDGAFCQQLSPALRRRHRRQSDDSSWRDDHLDERCVSVHQPGKSDRPGAVTYCTKTSLD